jgi:nitroimidazol reductase NimA-like FMN-containing flavoprotein (pyridoxamine 5'-phosphate oxidase superfamily)
MIDLGETTMTAEEIAAYLREDGRFAAVATLRKDGSPFAIPLGYYFDGDFLYFSTTPARGLTFRLRRDGRVSVSVFDHEAIHGYVIVNGVAEEIDDPHDVLSLNIHHRYPKPGLENSAEHDRIWLSAGRIVFRVSIAAAFGMDQRKASDSIWALAMPDVAAPGLRYGVESQSELGGEAACSPTAHA